MPASRARVAAPTRQYRLQCITFAAAAAVAGQAVAGQFEITKSLESTVHSSAWVGSSSSPYGRAINNNSFETSTIESYNGYQYTSFWRYQTGPTSGRVTVARRALGTATWETIALSDTISNGPNDAHNVISMGLDRTDGTIHLAYDLHGHNLRYRVTTSDVLNNPTTVAWNASLFASQRNWLVNSSSVVSGVTYPMFIKTPDNDLQVAFRVGSSGNGSWWMYDYDGATHAWSNGHQIDDGTVGTYSGTTTGASSSRNNYPNGFTYDSTGRLHSVFTWRESATGAANHDLLYVYSDDGGNIWKNNAGAVVANKSTGLKFTLNSPGLVVRPLAENQTLMNQQGQAVDREDRIHSIGWHRDTAKTNPATNNVWEANESSYFQYWRDDIGNWHQNKLPGNVGQRPKILFDSDGNAFAIYQVLDGGGTLGNNALYITNGDLVVSAASKDSNWTDWKVIAVEQGNFLTEAQGEMILRNPAIAGSKDLLSVIMQNSPASGQNGNVGTPMRVFDYALNFTTPAVRSFSAADGNFGSADNWSDAPAPGLNTVVQIAGGSIATVDSNVGLLDNRILVGTGGTAGTLRVAAGATLDLLHDGPLPNSAYGGSIVVGADSGSVGTYEQTGGTVSAWRVAVGDYRTTTSGGGVSSATVSGGTLTTHNLEVGFSANGSSSGSTFNVSGTGNVVVNGELILGEFGNAATLNLTGGTLTVHGDLREGFNKTNSSTVILNGGSLDLTGNRVDVDDFQIKSGLLANFVGMRATGTLLRNDPSATLSLAALNTFVNVIQIDAGVVRVMSNNGLGSTAATIISGAGTTGRLEVWGGITTTEPLVLGGRQPGNLAPHILNVGGNNALNGNINTAVGGNQYNISSDIDTLTVNGSFLNGMSGVDDVRFLNLGGASFGTWNSVIADSSIGGANASKTAVTKRGNGAWTFMVANTYQGSTTIEAGTLRWGPNAINHILGNAGGLDIAGGRADFHWTTGGTDPTATILALLTAGAATDFATGQIRSSTADATHGLGWTRDEATASLIVAYTLYGDANLDGAVDFDDLLTLAQGYGTASSATWAGGDFDYNGEVGFDDLLALSQNYGGSLTGSATFVSEAAFAADWALARSLVPEPGTALVLAAFTLPLARRRR